MTKYESTASRSAAVKVLRDIWGHDDFRGAQWEVIEAVLNRRDVLGVLPTGTGKSICYQLPASVNDGLTLVISPLVALMRDQVESLGARGIAATSIDSSLTRREVDQRLTDCRYGKYRLLYVSPERLRSGDFIRRCEDLSIRTVAVDEAHCISEWGHSFRPAYREISGGLEHLGRPPIVALTATATPTVRRDIQTALELSDPVMVTGGFDRPNIVWSVFRNRNKRNRVEAVLGGVDGPGIVYATTRRESDDWAAWLQDSGVTAGAYHAGLSGLVRNERQEQWMDGRLRVIVATSAFGMGIDKADVRFVIHVSLPSGLEAYYQEAGRAGRDGKKSHAVVLYNDGDERVREGMIARAFPEPADISNLFDTICSVAGIPVGSSSNGPFVLNPEAIAEILSSDVGTVRAGVELLEREGVLCTLDAGSNDGYLRLLDIPGLRRQVDSTSSSHAAEVILSLLRNDSLRESRDRWRAFQISSLTRASGVPGAAVQSTLEYLSSLKVIDWKSSSDGALVVLNGARPSRLQIDTRRLRRGRRSSRGRLREMLRYIHSRTCRRERILVYFGESKAVSCGRCDVCIDKSVVAPSDESRRLLSKIILRHVRSGAPKSRWTFDASMDERSIEDCIDWLIGEGVLRPSTRLDGAFELVGPEIDSK